MCQHHHSLPVFVRCGSLFINNKMAPLPLNTSSPKLNLSKAPNKTNDIQQDEITYYTERYELLQRQYELLQRQHELLQRQLLVSQEETQTCEKFLEKFRRRCTELEEERRKNNAKKFKIPETESACTSDICLQVSGRKKCRRRCTELEELEERQKNDAKKSKIYETESASDICLQTSGQNPQESNGSDHSAVSTQQKSSSTTQNSSNTQNSSAESSIQESTHNLPEYQSDST